MRASGAALLVAACLFGCGGSDGGMVEATVSAWKSAGLSPTQLERAKDNKLAAKSCHTGKVSGIYVQLCEYETDDKARAGKAGGLKAIGDHTGVSLSRGKWLLVAIDKDKVDPSGRSVNKLAKAFWKE